MSFRLSYYLVQRKLLRVEDVDRACRRQQWLGGCLDTQLLELQLLDLDKLQEVLPKALELPSPTLSWLKSPSQEALSLVPVTWVKQFQAVPVALTERTLHMVVADHGPPSMILPLEYWLHRSIALHPVPELYLYQGMEKLYNIPMQPRFRVLSQRYPTASLFEAPESWRVVWQGASTDVVSEPAQEKIPRPISPQQPEDPTLFATLPGVEKTAPIVVEKTAPIVVKKTTAKEAQAPAPVSPPIVETHDTGQKTVREESEDQAMYSSLNLPPVSRLRNAFRTPTTPLPDEKTLAYDHGSASQSAAVAAATNKVPRFDVLEAKLPKLIQGRDPMRDTIQERKPEEFEKTRPIAYVSPDEDTSEGVSFSTGAKKASPEIDPFATKIDGTFLVKDVPLDTESSVPPLSMEKLVVQDTESSAPPTQAIFELAELFKPELPGAYTIPGLPAFPGIGQAHETDIFPEVTMPDAGWEPLTEDDEQVDALAQVSRKASGTDALPDKPVEKQVVDEFLACQEPEQRSILCQNLVGFGGALVPTMLQYIPAVEHVREKNPVLKERLDRLVELCESVGDPVFFRLLHVLEQAREGQKMQALILLGHWRTSRAIAPLLQNLYQETHPVIQRMLGHILRRYRGQAEFDKLLLFLRENLNSDHPYRLQKALFFLGHLRATETIQEIIPLLSHQESVVRSFALETLRLITLQNLDGNLSSWEQWWEKRGNKSRKQWVIDSMNHEELSVRQRVKDELRLEFGDDFGYNPQASVEERETVRRLASLWIQQG